MDTKHFWTVIVQFSSFYFCIAVENHMRCLMRRFQHVFCSWLIFLTVDYTIGYVNVQGQYLVYLKILEGQHGLSIGIWFFTSYILCTMLEYMFLTKLKMTFVFICWVLNLIHRLRFCHLCIWFDQIYSAAIDYSKYAICLSTIVRQLWTAIA